MILNFSKLLKFSYNTALKLHVIFVDIRFIKPWGETRIKTLTKHH